MHPFMQGDMRTLENCTNAHSELFPAFFFAAFTQTDAGFSQIIRSLAASTMRANRAFWPKQSFQMLEGGFFAAEVCFIKNGHCYLIII